MTRQEANLDILYILKEYVEQYPDWRFEQILCNLGIESVFYKESTETLEEMKLNHSIIIYE